MQQHYDNFIDKDANSYSGKKNFGEKIVWIYLIILQTRGGELAASGDFSWSVVISPAGACMPWDSLESLLK